jgi:hypothetical protein
VPMEFLFRQRRVGVQEVGEVLNLLLYEALHLGQAAFKGVATGRKEAVCNRANLPLPG